MTDDNSWQQLTAQLTPLKKRSYAPYVPPQKIMLQQRPSITPLNLTAPEKQLSHWHNLHRREQKRLKAGSHTPEAVLDLHGQSLTAAHSQLKQFIHTCVHAQYRLVLVITGKGTLSTGGGALRRALPLWLHDPHLSRFVAGFNNAHGKHGGLGAFYVVLRGLG